MLPYTRGRAARPSGLGLFPPHVNSGHLGKQLPTVWSLGLGTGGVLLQQVKRTPLKDGLLGLRVSPARPCEMSSWLQDGSQRLSTRSHDSLHLQT